MISFFNHISGMFPKREFQFEVIGTFYKGLSAKTCQLIDALEKNNQNRAYQVWSQMFRDHYTGFFHQVDGAFIIAWSDGNKGYIYKNPLCKLSMYYRMKDGILQWSTNPIDLLSENIRFNKQNILLGCLGENPIAGDSFYEGISRLPAGHLLTFENGTIDIWQVDRFHSLPAQRTLSGWAEEVRATLKETILRRIRPSQKIGVILSGGVDSSAVLCALKDAGVEVHAFHWHFDQIPAADESFYAKKASEHLGVPLHLIPFSSIIQSQSYFRSWNFSSPYNHSFYSLFEETRDRCLEMGIDTVSSGYLADFLFGSRGKRLSLLSLIRSFSLTGAIRYLRELWGVPNVYRNPDIEKFERLSWYEEFLSDSAVDWIKERYVSQASSLENTFLSLSDNEDESVVESHLFYPHRIAVFYPLLSRELIQLSLTLPEEYRLIPIGGQFVEKPVLRLAFLEKLPPEIISRNHRQLMTAANEKYVVENRDQILSILGRDSILASMEIVNPEKMEVMNMAEWARSASGLICCCMMELWLRSVLKGEEKNGELQNSS